MHQGDGYGRGPVIAFIEVIEYREFLERSADESQDNSPLANLDELITAAVEFDRQHPEDGSVEGFLEQIALVSSTDDWEDNSDKVTLMTLHASKGLEFPGVFIIGLKKTCCLMRDRKRTPRTSKKNAACCLWGSRERCSRCR